MQLSRIATLNHSGQLTLTAPQRWLGKIRHLSEQIGTQHGKSLDVFEMVGRPSSSTGTLLLYVESNKSGPRTPIRMRLFDSAIPAGYSDIYLNRDDDFDLLMGNGLPQFLAVLRELQEASDSLQTFLNLEPIFSAFMVGAAA